MILGGRYGRRCRCVLVWLAGSTVLAGVVTGLRAGPAELWARRRSLDGLPLDRAVVDLAALVVVLCGAWAWLALTATVADAWLACPRPAPHAGPWRLPARCQRLVLAACGVTLSSGLTAGVLAGPALADPAPPVSRHAVERLSGLPLPARVLSAPAEARHGAPPAPAAAARWRESSRPRQSGAPSLPAIPPSAPQAPRDTAGPAAARASAPARGTSYAVVRPGDSLWAIAARDLPDHASPATVAAHWQEIYQANRAVIGADPDLIVPGQRLVLPPVGPA